MSKILLSCKKGSDATAYIAALSRCGCRADAARAGASGLYDGLLLAGGGDISPRFYAYRGPIDRIRIEDEARDRLELELIREFMALGKPILGICRGAQILNTAFGGTLVEDIQSLYEMKAIQIRHEHHMHTVSTLPKSTLHAILGSQNTVNSFHHQAVRHPGRELKITARAPDGLAEAIEHETAPVLGIQWHPERMSDAASRRIFAHFCAWTQR